MFLKVFEVSLSPTQGIIFQFHDISVSVNYFHIRIIGYEENGTVGVRAGGHTRGLRKFLLRKDLISKYLT